MQNTGIIIKEQEADYLAGTIPYKEICKDWTPYLPADERQHGLYFDTKACATFSALNVVEIQVNYMIANNLLPKRTLDFLTENGYIVDGKFECSDRFTAKMSGTTDKGNYLQRVWDSVKHDGLLPESDWGYPRRQRTPVFDWDDYYKPIPQELKDKAKQLLNHFSFAYEWTFTNKTIAYTDVELAELKKQLIQAPLHLAAPTCNWGSGIIEPCGKIRASHATTIYKVDDYIYDFDHYDPVNKTLSLKYIMSYIMKGIVTLSTNNKNMILAKQEGHIYLIEETVNFGWSIPEPKYQHEIIAHCKRCGVELADPIDKDLTGYYIIRGATALAIKEFFNT